MRAGWKKIAPELFTAIVLLTVTQCSPYRKRSAEEIRELPTNITPLPESLLVLPINGSENGHTIIGFTVYPEQVIMQYSIDTEGELSVCLAFGLQWLPHPIALGKTDLEGIQTLVYELNNIGYFSITDDLIINKIYAKSSGILEPLIISPEEAKKHRDLYVGSGIPPQYECHFRLQGIDHKLTYPGMYEDSVYYENIPEIRVAKECMLMIEDFLDGQVLHAVPE
jgi:hypothetical protein